MSLQRSPYSLAIRNTYLLFADHFWKDNSNPDTYVCVLLYIIYIYIYIYIYILYLYIWYIYILIYISDIHISEAYSEPCQASKMELFAKIVNGYDPYIYIYIYMHVCISDLYLESNNFAGMFSHETWYHSKHWEHSSIWSSYFVLLLLYGMRHLQCSSVAANLDWHLETRFSVLFGKQLICFSPRHFIKCIRSFVE